MIKINQRIAKLIYFSSLFVAALSVNVTCYGRYYQERLDAQLNNLRKYKDEK